MWLLFALTAACLTSFLPIVNKRLLADTPVSVVAWGVNALSLPLLGLLAVILLPIPLVDSIFWLGIVSSAVLNLAATLISTQALKLGDASLVTPVLTFNPAFTLFIAIFTLGEVPSWFGVLGVLVILAGGYVLNIQHIKAGWWRPLTALVTQRAMLLAVVASFIWGLTPISEKLAIQHSSPANPPVWSCLDWLLTDLPQSPILIMTLACFPGELAQVGAQLVADAAEQREPFDLGAVKRGRVVKVMVQPLGCAEEDGTGKAGVVTHGDDVIEALALEVVHVLGTLSRNINPQLAHDGDRFGPDGARLRPGAVHCEPLARIVT